MKKLSDIPPEMRGYYYVIACMSVFIVLVIGVNLLGNISRRSDSRLEQEVQSQNSKIDSYASRNKKLPDTPLDAGIDESKNVEYKKVSDSKYMLCADFKTKSDGYDTRYVMPMSDVMLNGAAMETSAKNTKYVDGSKNYQKHDKGYTCLVYEPYVLREENLYPYKVCGDRYRASRQYMDVEEVNIASETIKARYQYGYGEDGPQKYDLSYAIIYDKNCKKVDINALKDVTEVDIYSNSSTDTVGQFKDSKPAAVKIYK